MDKQKIDVHVHVHHHDNASSFGGRTRLGVCLDRSGSMESIRDATISGFNEWLTDQKRLTSDGAVLTMVKFDTEYEFPYVNQPLGGVAPLTRDTFVPRGGTALNDAIVKTIQAIDKEMGATNDRAVVLILTDGEENSSKEYKSADSVRTIIHQKEATGRWTFVFMRGTLDQQAAFNQARSYGLLHNIRSYTPDAAGAISVFAAASQGTSNMRTSSESSSKNFFNDDQTSTGLITGPVAQAMSVAEQAVSKAEQAVSQADTAATAGTDPAPESPTTDNTTYTSE